MDNESPTPGLPWIKEGQFPWMMHGSRLLVHEMIHMWKGKYAFSYSEDNWGYSDDLSGFEEIAEGLAYEILHDYRGISI